MSSLVPERAASAVPALPVDPNWAELDDTTDDDHLFDGVTAAVKIGAPLDPKPPPATIAPAPLGAPPSPARPRPLLPLPAVRPRSITGGTLDRPIDGLESPPSSTAAPPPSTTAAPLPAAPPSSSASSQSPAPLPAAPPSRTTGSHASQSSGQPAQSSSAASTSSASSHPPGPRPAAPPSRTTGAQAASPSAAPSVELPLSRSGPHAAHPTPARTGTGSHAAHPAPARPGSGSHAAHPSAISSSGSGPHPSPIAGSGSGSGSGSVAHSIVDSNDETDAVQIARRAERHTVAGIKTPHRSARRLPLMADRSAPIPKLPDLEDELAPRLPAPPPILNPRTADPPRGPDGSRLPLRAAPATPPAGHPLPRAVADAAARSADAAARSADHTSRSADHTSRSAERSDRSAERHDRAVDHTPRSAERSDRDRAERHDRAVDHTSRSAERSDRDRAERHDRAVDRSDRHDAVARSADRSDRDRADRADRADRSADRNERAADRAERAADRADRNERAADRAERAAPLPEPKRAEAVPRPAPGSPARAEGRQPPAAGRVIAGRYQILERIGAGGMGKVYKVRHAQLAKTFALKVIGENLADTDEARELFYREARLASAVNHPSITSVVDFGEDPEVGAFMVMELVEGEPIHRILRRENRLSPRLACEIILQVADALHYIHSEGIVHCDIKTENILVAEQTGTKRRQILVKLLDFGLARSLTGGRGSGPLSGTPHYVSPERIRGDAATPSSDLYALGILFYELLTGHVPWDGAVSKILAGHLEEPPTPPSTLVPGLDPALETLILRALAKTPADRHKDMAAFIYELRTAMDMMGFGRTRRGGGKRVVIERSKNERDALAARVVDGCRLPLALVSRDGVILVANPACARFVMGVVVEIEGLPLLSTPLAGAWKSLDGDLARAAAASPIRRILEIDVPNGPPQRLMVWLDPCGDAILFGVQPLDA